MPIGGPFRRRLTTSTLGVDYFWTPIMAYFSAPIDRSYARKPRGGPAGLGREHAERFSFCCAVDDCRKRATPPSLRFLGRHVYLATVVTLISALMLGATPSRLARLSVVPGLDRRTLARWRVWWRSTFTESPFAPVAMAAVVPPLDIAALPVSLLERFGGDMREQLVALLRFLGPLTGGASAMRAFCRAPQTRR